MFTELYKRYALAIMTAVYTLNLVDRTLIMLLLQPIKNDLHLSDTQLGFITGIAFGFFYATFGVPFGRWADRGNRVTITSLAIGLWGLTVMSTVFAKNFLQLVIARVAGGIGESGCRPPTYSLIGDYFPNPIERTRAIAIYFAGGPLSGVVGFLAGGWLNEMYGWRTTLFLAGLPGLVLALLVKTTIVEPRRASGVAHATQHTMPSMRVVLGTLWSHPSLRHLSLGLISMYIMSTGMAPWYAAFMVRSHGMGTAELGAWFALIMGGGGIFGVLAGGYVATRWFAGNERAQMRMTAISFALLLPCFVAFLTLPQKQHALLALLPLTIVFNIFQGPAWALMQRLVPDDMRATIMAVTLLLMNLIGYAIGPQLVGILSDVLAPVVKTDSLRYAMLVTSLVALWSSYHFWRVGRTVPEDLAVVAARAGDDVGVRDRLPEKLPSTSS